MTNTEKQTIDRLRTQGKSFTAIAADTGIGISAIKMYCQRKKEDKPADGYCLQCGKPVSYVPHKKKKKFCCDACRMAWWNTHQEQVNRKSGKKQICPYCGESFMAYGNKHRVYCSRGCYALARSTEAVHEC